MFFCRSQTLRGEPMKPLYRLIAIAAFVAPAAALSAPAPQPSPESVPGPRYMMTHIEVVARGDARWRSTAIKAYRQAAMKEPGAIAVDIFQESGHPSRFIISEVWRDHQALRRARQFARGPRAVREIEARRVQAAGYPHAFPVSRARRTRRRRRAM